MTGRDEDTSLLVARSPEDGIAAVAMVEWTVTRRVRFATLADLSVDPKLRSSGLGASMVAEVEAEARRRGMEWIFLESGKNNLRAHAFFEQHGFREISHVFARKL